MDWPKCLYSCSIITYVHRYKIHEEKLFIEKESLRSQLEAAQEEKAKLLKVTHVIKFCVISDFIELSTFTAGVFVIILIFCFRSVRASRGRMPRSLGTGILGRRSSTMPPSRWRTANSKRSAKKIYTYISIYSWKFFAKFHRVATQAFKMNVVV